MLHQLFLVNWSGSHRLRSVNKGRVIFEIGGVPIREELARDGMPYCFFSDYRLTQFSALRQASEKLPTKMEFIHKSAPPRLGNMLIVPPKPTVPTTSAVDRTVEVEDVKGMEEVRKELAI